MLDFGIVLENIPILLQGLVITLLLTLAAIFISTILGILLAYYFTKATGFIKSLITIYIEIMRNIPLLVILYFIYFGLGEIAVNVSSLNSIIIALVLSNTAYLAEIFRAGIDSIHKTQMESGLALGLHDYQVYMRIVIPQAIINVFPSIINQYVIILLSSSFASVVALPEFTSTISRLSSFSFRTFEYYIFGALVYLGVAFLISVTGKIIFDRLKNNSRQIT